MLVFDDRYLTKTKKIRTYGGNVYTNSSGLNVPKDGLLWIFYSHFYWFFTCLWKQISHASIMLDYLDGILFETDED